jgi:serine/threonine protein kinase
LLFGKYKIDRLVGRGAFGWVYRAINMETNREVAMKIIDFEEISSYYTSEEAKTKIRDTLLTEESHLRKCHSAHIIKVIDSFENDNCKVIILEYCNSGTLQDYLRKRGAIEEPDAIVILKQILFGIAVQLYLHRKCTEMGSFIGI